MARYKSPAMRRYVIRVAALMSFYIAALLVASYVFRHDLVSGPLASAMAIIPALPIIGVFWAVMRLLVEEPDEFLRMLMVRQNLIATGFCLTVMTIWEFLQNFDLVADSDGGYGAAFFWFVGLGVGALYNWRTAGTAGNCA